MNQSISKRRFNNYIINFEFDRLFNQLGWDYVNETIPKKVKDETFTFHIFASKSNFTVLECYPNTEGNIPDAQTRKKIHRELSSLYHEHMIIFIDKDKNIQQWEMVIHEPNKPMRTVSHKWYKRQDPELLYQKLSGAFFSLKEDEEGSLTIIDVVERLKENFGVNAEKITKKFYTDFKKQHTQFLDFISGIDDALPNKENKNKQWYASLMLNRLMFCYFIQKKGFLNNDRHYLKNKLNECEQLQGNSNFYSFYRSFLLELFHDGLGQPTSKRHKDIPVELGEIPYLNGGLFDVHELEQQFDEIEIQDDAFEKIFSFFDEWEWHLDTRQQSDGKTINPDVIGYIFEKYINDRAQMGAYYTKEDITDYIGKNTILPFLFDETQRHYSSGFAHGTEIWTKLKESGDRYIYDAVKKGIPKNGDIYSDLPDNIMKGFVPELENKIVTDSDDPHLWELRKEWNRKALEEIALPTETYRELIDRRERYKEIKEKIEKGEIDKINDFITYNLNIRQFTQDFIETTEDPDFIRHFYKALKKITILDPTCGSGAFLFAAMNILEPLYESCLTRMEEFCEEEPGKHTFFKDVLDEIQGGEHSSLTYFIYKSIILNNLYGVDIMKEAVEIAKLRLFLKLVSTVDVSLDKPNYGLEPLPDIDFNIRAGNTLVGFATEKELQKTIIKTDDLFAQAKLDDFKEQFEIVSKAFQRFQDEQLLNDKGSDVYHESKNELKERLKVLTDKLDKYLAGNYGINAEKYPDKFRVWYESHQPFHWMAEFYQIIVVLGGFDVIIGNPPYIEHTAISNYKIIDFKTTSCGNLYANVSERAIILLSKLGFFGFIVPISLTCSKRMRILQNILNGLGCYYSNYSWRPSKLFEGADKANLSLTVFIVNSKFNIYTSSYIRWNSEARNQIFDSISYQTQVKPIADHIIPRLGEQIENNIYLKTIKGKTFNNYQSFRKTNNELFYKRTGGLYWKIFTDFRPILYLNGIKTFSSKEESLYFSSKEYLAVSLSVLWSNLFWWWYIIHSDVRNNNPSDLNSFPIPESVFDNNEIENLASVLMESLKENMQWKERKFKGGKSRFQQFYPKYSKSIIDKIDFVLAKYYGFTERELDFLINYDIKYRMSDLLDE